MRVLFFLSMFASSAALAAVSFTNEVAPIFAQKCIACHSEQKAKGNFQLHTFQALIKGAKGDPVLVPGEPDKSKLFQALTANDPDDRMPQEDDPLPATQIAIIKQWIQEGAKFDGPDRDASIKTFVTSLNFPDPPTVYPQPIPVIALAFSPNGSQLLSSGYHEALIWNPLNGQLIRRIKPLPQRIQAFAYSPDGKWLAIASGTPARIGQVHLFDGESLRQLSTSPDVVLAIAFNPDGTLLAAGGADNAIRVFEMPSGKLKFKTEQHADWVMGLAFHPTTNLIVSASRDKTARIVNSLTGELEATYQGHSDGVFAAVFSGDGKHVYSAGRDKKIHAWEIKEGKKAGDVGVDSEIYKLILRDKDLFACGADKLVRQFRVANPPEPIHSFSGHQDVVYALAFHPGTHSLASGSYDGEVRIWNTETGELMNAFKAAPAQTSSQHFRQGVEATLVLGRGAD